MASSPLGLSLGKRTNYWIALAALVVLLLLLRRGPTRNGVSFADNSILALDDYSDFPEWPAEKKPKRGADETPLKSKPTAAAGVAGGGVELSYAKNDDRLVELARNAMENGLVVLVYASYSYRQPLFNWLVSLQKAKPGPVTRGVVLICLDDALVTLVEQLGWDCYKEAIASSADQAAEKAVGSLDKDTVKTLWLARVSHVDRLLRAGISLVLSDTDAIWRKDPRAELMSQDGDIIASRANFPYDSPWGATICMGFIFLRASPSVTSLSKSFLEQTVESQDDQIGINRALYALPFEDKSGRRQAFGRKLQPGGNNVAKAVFYVNQDQKNPLRVTLLSHSAVARYCAQIEEKDWGNVWVAHCHVNEGKPAPTQKHKGNQASHTAILEKYHLYLLRPDWESVVNGAAAKAGSKASEQEFDDLVRSLQAEQQEEEDDDAATA